MPNWCSNSMTVTGPEADIKKFKKYAEGYGAAWDGQKPPHDDGHRYLLDLNKFVPIPLEVLTNSIDCRSAYRSGGYDWCVTNWGTKWNCLDVTVEIINPSRLDYYFVTAWSPPSTKVLIAMGEKFPTLKFLLDYIEEGASFEGTMIVENGSLIGNSCHDIVDEPKKPDDVREADIHG